MKLFCLSCKTHFESEAPAPCPKCKGERVKDGEMVEFVMNLGKELINDLRKPVDMTSPDNGVAGSGVGKSVILYTKDKHGQHNGFRFLSLSKEMKEWGEALKMMIRNKAPHGANESVGAEGGYLTPTEELLNSVIEVVYNQSIFLPSASVIQTSAPLVRLPKLAQALDPGSSLSYFPGLSFKWLEEAGTKSASKPTWEYCQLQPWELAALIPVTNILIEDAVINIINYIAGLMTRYYSYFLDNVFVNGNGAAKPLGIIPDPNTITVARGTGGAVKFQDLINMDARLNELFTEAVWLMRKATGMALRTELTAGNVPIWTDPFNPGVQWRFLPPVIGGYPVIYCPFPAAKGTEGDVILCDRRFYGIAMRRGLTFAESDHFYFDTNEKALRYEARVDGKELVHEAFVILTDAAQ